MADRPVVAHLDAVWSSIDHLVTGLDDEEWDRPTDCPGWTIRDQLSHIVGTESRLLGLHAPASVDPAAAPHVHNTLGLSNEAWVAQRRGRSGSEVLAEFRHVTAERLVALRSMTDEQMAATADGPLGPMPYEAFMEIRVMDCWVHEQDIRRALRRPGHLVGPVPEAAIGRFTAGLGYVVAKRSEAPEGSTVVVRLKGPMARDVAVVVIDGRARPAEPAPADPTVTLAMTAETYACLSCGRWSPAEVVAGDRVRISGDRALAERILGDMSIVP